MLYFEQIPYGKRDPYEEKIRRKRIREEMEHDKIKIKKRPKITDPITLSKYNENQFESLSRYTNKCESLSSLGNINEHPIWEKSTSDKANEINEEIYNHEMMLFMKKNSKDSFPPYIKHYKTEAPSFAKSYKERTAEKIYPLPVTHVRQAPQVPHIDTKIPNSSETKKRMKKYLKERGEKITSYLK